MDGYNALSFLAGAKPLDPIDVKTRADNAVNTDYENKLRQRIMVMGGEEEANKQKQQEAYMKSLVANSSMPNGQQPTGDLYQQYGAVMGQQAAAAQQMKLYTDEFNTVSPTIDSAVKSMITNNDQEGIKGLSEQLSGSTNPLIKKMGEYVKSVQVTGTGEATFTASPQMMKESPKLIQDWAAKAATPEIAEAIKMINPKMSVEVKMKKGKVIEIKPVQTPDEKNETNEQIVKGMLREKLKREPTQKELYDALLNEKKDIAKAGAAGRSEITLRTEQRRKDIDAQGQFKSWPQDVKEQVFKEVLLDPSAKPRFTGMKAINDQEQFEREYATWKVKNKIAPGDVVATHSDIKALQTSLKDLTKNEKFIAQSVSQANKNRKEVSRTSKEYARSKFPGPNRFLNWWNDNLTTDQQKKFGQFKVALLAFSREYMKVVTGSARSVSELSISAAATADEILRKFDSWEVLEAKLDQAQKEMNNFNKSNNEEIQNVKKQIKNAQQGNASGGGLHQPLVNYIKSNLGKYTDEQIYKSVKKNNPRLNDAQIYEYYKAAKGE